MFFLNSQLHLFMHLFVFKLNILYGIILYNNFPDIITLQRWNVSNIHREYMGKYLCFALFR